MLEIYSHCIVGLIEEIWGQHTFALAFTTDLKQTFIRLTNGMHYQLLKILGTTDFFSQIFPQNISCLQMDVTGSCSNCLCILREKKKIFRPQNLSLFSTLENDLS